MKSPFTALLAVALVASSGYSASPPGSTASVEGFTVVKTAGGITEYRLPTNDLGVLLMEDHSAPVLTFMVTYRVGSRNEVTGTTGATHLLEHLMFKGSKNFHPGIGTGFDSMMDKVGGINNATTWLDRTNYYENLPSDQLGLAVALEADRMRNLLLREEDRQPEMTVVRNEFERGENDPVESLDKEVNAAAIIAHPYHHSTIGWRSDIENVPIEKLREFYDTFYWPNNATISVIGDFQPATALRLIREHFGPIGRAPRPIPQIYTEEPPQTGPRRVVVRRPGEVGVVEIAYKVPRALHRDHAPLEVLAAVLSEGKTSRLYRAIIDANLGISADATKGYFHDDTLFTLSLMLAPEITHEQAENALLAEIEKVKKDGVADAEVSRAINKILAAIAFQRDGSFAIAGQINETIAVGDWTQYVTLPEQLKAVTAADLQRVARAYLNEDQSTTGWFIPLAEQPPSGKSAAAGGRSRDLLAAHTDADVAGGREAPASRALGRRGAPDAPPYSARGPHHYSETDRPAERARLGQQRTEAAASRPAPTPQGTGGGTALVAPKVRRRSIANLDVLTVRSDIKDVVTLRGVLSGGDVFNPPDNSAVADLVAGMLDKGTQARDKFAVAEVLEETGATLAFGAASHTVNFSAKCLRKDLPLVIGLLAEQLRTPRFDPEEFAKLKKQLAGRHKRQMEDTGYRAESTFARTIFPPGHPNRPPPDDKYLADIETATLPQLKAYHERNYGPAAARIVAVGDVDDAALDRALAEAFTGWKGGQPIPGAPKVPAPGAARVERVNMPGKTSVSYLIGQPSHLKYSDPDYQSLNMATSILGSGFFSARLLDIIRGREGLTYGIGAALTYDTYNDGAWYIEGTFAPDLLDKGISSTRRELERFHERGVTAEELATFKVTLTGSYKVALSTTGGVATALLNALQRGYGPEWVDEYPRRLQALTLEQVNGSIKKYLHPDKMVAVLAGTLAESEPGAAK